MRTGMRKPGRRSTRSGSLGVEETIYVDFADVEHHGIVRELQVRYDLAPDDTQVDLPQGREPRDYRRVLDISSVEVSSTAPDDVEITREGDFLLVRIGDPDVTVTGRQTYRLP